MVGETIGVILWINNLENEFRLDGFTIIFMSLSTGTNIFSPIDVVNPRLIWSKIFF